MASYQGSSPYRAVDTSAGFNPGLNFDPHSFGGQRSDGVTYDGQRSVASLAPGSVADSRVKVSGNRSGLKLGGKTRAVVEKSTKRELKSKAKVEKSTKRDLKRKNILPEKVPRTKAQSSPKARVDEKKVCGRPDDNRPKAGGGGGSMRKFIPWNVKPC